MVKTHELALEMNYWLLTDTHFGHQKMLEYCQRPPRFEEIMLTNIQKCVQIGDVVIHLGDFCIYLDEYWHVRFRQACPALRWLIRGNHDRKSLGWYRDHGWDFVADQFTMEIYGKRVAFSHRPITAHSDFDLNIHGHHHNTRHHPEDEVTEKHRLIYMEHHYAPISLRSVVERGLT